MAPSTSQRARAAWKVARRQHDIITHDDLIAAGFTRDAIKHALKRGRLHRVYRGVYKVGSPNIARHGQWMAAVLYCGPTAVLSHQSAAALWGILGDRRRPIHVSLPSPGDRRSGGGTRIHRRRTLGPGDVTRDHNIPVTTPIATIIDLATCLDDPALERVIGQADVKDLVDPEALREAVEGVTRAGAGRLKRVLDRQSFVVTHSELERRFLAIVRQTDLPVPESQRQIGTNRVDFYFHDLGLVVECDGLRYHRTAAQQAKDREREHAYAKGRLLCLRLTHHHVVRRPGYAKETLLAYAARARLTS